MVMVKVRVRVSSATAENSRKARGEHHLTAASVVRSKRRKKKEKPWSAAGYEKIFPLQNLVAWMNSEPEARRM